MLYWIQNDIECLNEGPISQISVFVGKLYCLRCIPPPIKVCERNLLHNKAIHNNVALYVGLISIKMQYLPKGA